MKDSKPVVVGIGELLWDVLPTGKRAGGAPINFVYHATQLGAEGYAVSAVGNDVFGTEIVQELDKNGICHLLGTVEYPTGSVMVELKDGIPTYTIIEGVAWDHIPLTQEAVDLVKEADAICFGTLAQRSPESRATIHALLSYARKEALRFFDVNIRQSYYSKELIASLLEEANVFKINDEELDLIREMFSLSEDEDTACRQLVERYSLRYMILTAGSRYSSVYTVADKSTILTPKVEVADTVGAGDYFYGALVYSILAGKSFCLYERGCMACLSYIKTDYEREKLVYKADPSDVSFLHDGICGFGRNCLQLCEVGFRIDGFRSEYLSFFSVLLVSDLFRPDGNVDE